MRLADAAFCAYLSALVVVVAFMAVGSASPVARSRGQVTGTTALSAGPVPPSRVAGAFDR
jgi:hypothetical protein